MNATHKKIRKITITTVVILFTAWLVDYIDRFLITIALPSISDDFGLSAFQQGLVLSTFYFSYALMQIPGGFLADKFGAKKIMAIGMVGWSVFTAATGLAFSYVTLLAARLLFGVAEGIFPAASYKAIAERTTRKKRMTVQGFTMSSNQLGGALGTLVGAPIIVWIGWQHTFLAFAVLGVLMSLALVMFLPRKLTAEEASHGETEGSQEETNDGGVSNHKVEDLGIQVSNRDLLKSWTMWRFFFMFMGYNIVQLGIVTWMPTYLIKEKHVSLAATGVLSSIPSLIAIFATILGGWLFDRYFHRHHRRMIVPLSVITAIFLFFMLSADTVTQFVVFESLGIFCSTLCFMPIFGMPMRMLSSAVAGVGNSMVSFGGQVSGIITPMIIGALVQAFSYEVGFGFLIFGAALTAVCSLSLPETQQGFQKAISKNIGLKGTKAG
ncbi:sugar phosphate permease [Scopulibacillus darangshiensis]|uniref:Sugar phosphate permease n=1 Tax=Scopulibacillus darangshiensis TaxID=442528 RepID=A0A4R2P4C4_9BACL|nr:MFS transporter [Scopulibacillus darangshiensis]TCP29592.1 sugar phosphate permease [Scopulibacillus darangshiensis]